MYECHAPEKLIKKQIGHRSIDALQVYERESLTQQQAVSSVVASTQYMDFKDVAVPLPREQVLDAFTQGPPAPGTPAPTKGFEVVQPRDTAGLVAGWSIQSCSNCTINITLGKQTFFFFFLFSMYSKTLFFVYTVSKVASFDIYYFSTL